MKFAMGGGKASYYKGLLLVLFILSGKGGEGLAIPLSCL
jgi:hypothetical protein